MKQTSTKFDFLLSDLAGRIILLVGLVGLYYGIVIGAKLFGMSPTWVRYLEYGTLVVAVVVLLFVTFVRWQPLTFELGYASDRTETRPKEDLHCLFCHRPDTPEGKYLVQRRDGSIPPWPSFVFGAADPDAAGVLLEYARLIEWRGYHPDLVASVRRRAVEFTAWLAEHGPGDPEKGPHRVDDPATVARMKLGNGS